MMFLNEQQRSLPVIDQSIFQACFPGFNQNELQVDENDIVENGGKQGTPRRGSPGPKAIARPKEHSTTQQQFQLVAKDRSGTGRGREATEEG